MSTKNILPLTDNVLYLDNSFLEMWTTCPRSFEYGVLRKRTLAEDRAALNFGTAIHGALEIRGRNEPELDIFEIQKLQLTYLSEYFNEHAAPQEDYRNCEFASTLIQKYNEYYPSEPFKVLTHEGKRLIECSLAVPLADFNVSFQVEPIHVIWTGKADVVAEWPDGSVWCHDHKTASRLGSMYFNDFLLSQPQTGYVWATQQILKRPVSGYMMNAIGSHKMTSKKTDDERFLRQKFPIDQERLDEWFHNTVTNITDMLADYERDFFPMRTEKHCNGKYGKCQFLDVCMLPRTNREVMLESGMYKENTWSPLAQEEI